jgi:hypothetical protein
MATTKKTSKKEDSKPETLKSLQAKIPESVKNEIKAYGLMRGMDIHQFVVEMFEVYKKQDKV